MAALAAARPRASRTARIEPPVFRRVLAVTDPESDASAAIAHATLLAGASGGDPILLPSWDLSPMVSRRGHQENSRGRGEAGSLDERSDAPDGIAAIAGGGRPPVDLVVVGSRGRTGKRIEAAIHRVAGRAAMLWASGMARPYRRILVATDMSAASRRALRLAARLGAQFGAELIVQHAFSSAHGEAAARAALERFLPRELARRGPRLLLQQGKPWAAVVRAAEQCGADLAIVHAGSPGSGDPGEAARVVRHAGCPVMVA
jgi:nucleotide-binding universal stress UspA family protein